MRIRQVRPEFFTDPVMAGLAAPVRLTYIGLWCVADDAGWLRWDVPQIGAILYPFEVAKRRERALVAASLALVDAGRLVILDCNCAQIPTLPRHQRVAGNQSFTARDAHKKHASSPALLQGATGSPVEVGNVEERRVEVNGRSGAKKDEALLAAFRRQGMPVDAA